MTLSDCWRLILPFRNALLETEDIGLDKARNAARQAFDIQRMNGTSHTIPVIFAETCGLALVFS